MIELVKEFIEFLGERKKLWLLPVVMIMVSLGGFIVFTNASTFAPFLYALF